MKERKLLDAIGMADEEYVSEAAPTGKKRLHRPIYIAVAACLCFTLTVSLGIIIWQNSGIRKYKDSEYYGVIKVLGEYYDYLDSRPSSSGGSVNDSEKADESVNGEQYVEVTDNQEEAVIEGDRFKRSDRYVYYIYDNWSGGKDRSYLNVYSIEGEYSQRKASFEIETEVSYIYNTQLYLSADCQTLTVILDCWRQEDSGFYTNVYAYDVSDVSNICLKGKWSSGSSFVQTRLVGDELILVTRWSAKRNADFDDLTQYVPHYDAGDGVQFVPADKIYHPQSVRNSAYYMFTKLDINSLSVIDVAATLSYTEEMYFTEDTVYLQCVQKDKTLISGLRYRGEGGMTLLGTAEVKDRILNQYSMDEHEGILRLVTNEGLYCISLEDWTIKASVLGFVPEGEDVKSVRFDGDYAYVCTAVVAEEILDPVFFFDLSDLSNITYKQTEEIPGYSHSLVNFGGGYLLGIGYDEESRGKIEIYKESENGVEAVCQYIANGWISGDYKAFYIDRQNQRIGFSADNRHYVVLEFDGESLNVKDEIAFAVDRIDHTRAFCDDGYLYLFESTQFKVYDLESGREREPVYGYLLPKDTNLEFWIDQGTVDVDYSQYTEYARRVYLGTGYTSEGNALPECYVLYTISLLHPDRIRQIQITDPAVKLYGLSLDSSKEEIVSTMEAEGFNVGEIESGQTIVAIKTMFEKRYSIYFSEKEIRMTVETLP